MFFKRVGAVLGLTVMLLPVWAAAQDQDSDLRAQIQEIRQQLSQMDDLKAKLADLEKRLEESEKARKEAAANSVTTGFAGEKVKLDGRYFVGVFSSGDQGAYRNWSTDVSDAKLRFTLIPSDRTTVVTRLSENSAKTGDFDYFYLDYARFLSPTNTLRVGQRKIDFGQDTWTNAPEESFLVTTSAPNVTGYGTGVALVGRVPNALVPPAYEVGFVNGPKGVMVRPNNALPYNIKLGAPLTSKVFASASWFDTGRLQAVDSSPLSVAEISSAPAGATSWRRTIWEADLRYNEGPNGFRSVLPWGDMPGVMLGATYGAFKDNATGAPSRNGNYWLAEGLLKLSPRLYTAARYSIVDLDDGLVAPLAKSPVDVNSYSRTSFGFGYKLSDLTLLKTEYAINHTSGGTSSPSLNQFAIGMAARF